MVVPFWRFVWREKVLWMSRREVNEVTVQITATSVECALAFGS